MTDHRLREAEALCRIRKRLCSGHAQILDDWGGAITEVCPCDGCKFIAKRMIEAGFTLADSASTNSDTSQYLLVDGEPTEEMVEAGMEAAKVERWIFTTDGALWVVIRAILAAALAVQQKGEG